MGLSHPSWGNFMPTCGATNRQGQPCAQPARPNGRCRYHGGKSPGPPLTAGGLHSKYFPTRLLARFQEAEAHPDLLTLRADAAALTTRFHELLERLDDAAGPTAWARALELLTLYLADPVANADALPRLHRLLQHGTYDGLRWTELADLIERRRKLIETDAKRTKDLALTLDAREAQLLVTALAHAVQRHVTDPTALRAIQAELTHLLKLRPETPAHPHDHQSLRALPD